MTERIASRQPEISGSAWGWNQAEAIMNDSLRVQNNHKRLNAVERETNMTKHSTSIKTFLFWAINHILYILQPDFIQQLDYTCPCWWIQFWGKVTFDIVKLSKNRDIEMLWQFTSKNNIVYKEYYIPKYNEDLQILKAASVYSRTK